MIAADPMAMSNFCSVASLINVPESFQQFQVRTVFALIFFFLCIAHSVFSVLKTSRENPFKEFIIFTIAFSLVRS